MAVKTSAELEQLSAVHSVPLPVVVFAAYLVSSRIQKKQQKFLCHLLRSADILTASGQLPYWKMT